MRQVTRRAALLAAGGVAGWAATRATAPGLPTLAGTHSLSAPSSATILNDASGLSATPVHKHLVIRGDPDDTLIAAIRAEMKDAGTAGRAVNISAARHSMGGQSIPRDGHALTFDSGFVERDSDAGTYRVHAGARWSQVIAALDPAGWSPKVMQSNHDFGVASTFCVNAHGWPVPFGQMGATVRAFRLILPDGDLLNCSRSENTRIFNATMGGYGLTGAIVDMQVEMVKNQRLDPTYTHMDAEAFAPAFQDALDDPAVTMAYGRLNVGRAQFFEQAQLTSYRAAQDQNDLPPASGSGMAAKAARALYRAQLGREPIKRLRWWTETTAGPLFNGAATRNSLINEPVVTLADRDPARTDILHEYFIGFDRFTDFLSLCRTVIPASYQEFLNVTLRYVAQDDESLLSYATAPRIAAVMSFSQEMTARAEADMQRMTRALVEGITAIGGTYYLPYRPHASVAQFTKAYARASEFAALKRQLDPGVLFRNNLWDRYLESL